MHSLLTKVTYIIFPAQIFSLILITTHDSSSEFLVLSSRLIMMWRDSCELSITHQCLVYLLFYVYCTHISLAWKSIKESCLEIGRNEFLLCILEYFWSKTFQFCYLFTIQSWNEVQLDILSFWVNFLIHIFNVLIKFFASGTYLLTNSERCKIKKNFFIGLKKGIETKHTLWFI